jgi:formylglycine-generating enzyme required for sulfatase activity
MKTCFFILMISFAVMAQAGAPPQAEKPLTKDQIMVLVKAGMDNTQLAKAVGERGIDFEPTDDYVEALRKAGAQDVLIHALHAARPQPLTEDQVLQLVAGGVPSQRAAALVTQRGVDFTASDQYLDTLRTAGADDTLLTAVRQASAAVRGNLVIETSPDAEVYLDGELQGRANAQGQLALKPKLGAHALKVTLKGKKDFEQSVTLAGLQAVEIEARLADAPGSIRVRTQAGARVTLDNESRGSSDANGELVLSNLSRGVHELRISAPLKKDYQQAVTVLGGEENRVEAKLENLTAGTLRENTKDGLKYAWIPPGTFMMGCSPGDSQCAKNENPPHQVTITRGFWIGQVPVTVRAYKRFAGATGRQMPDPPSFNSGWTNENMPIVGVDWNDAQAYCGWVGGRLPTEAEWEYAARGGSTEARYGPIDEIAWYGKSGREPHPVAQKRANGFGLYDVLGYVSEWVNDWYDGNYYQSSPAQDPQGPGSGRHRVLRGGSWGINPRLVRVSDRDNLNPAVRNSVDLGFRCGGEAGIP